MSILWGGNESLACVNGTSVVLGVNTVDNALRVSLIGVAGGLINKGTAVMTGTLCLGNPFCRTILLVYLLYVSKSKRTHASRKWWIQHVRSLYFHFSEPSSDFMFCQLTTLNFADGDFCMCFQEIFVNTKFREI